MAGHYLLLPDRVRFVPRFPFLEGRTYTIEVDGRRVGELARAGTNRPAVASVTGIWPTATHVPRNLLRFYIGFSARMSAGSCAKNVRLCAEDGSVLEHALFSIDDELWDGERQRLTVLLDPARIKRGLVAHRRLGYPLEAGQTIRVLVDRGFLDAGGRPLCEGAERTYRVAPDERRRVDPTAWKLRVPVPGSSEGLEVVFDRSLDHALIDRCLRVLGPDGKTTPGYGEAGPGESSWTYHPTHSWPPGEHRLVVDPVLEDLAGNSVRRVFDRDLSWPEHQPPVPAPVERCFRLHAEQ
jgi:hypothetical protein